jgi:hypothetical protein
VSAQIIQFDPNARSRAKMGAEEAWERFDRAHRRMADLYSDPTSSRTDRLNASMEAVRMHRAFVLAMEAM